MDALLPVVVGGLYAAALFLMLRRGLAQLIIGLAILSNAANLLIFTASGVSRGGAPLVPSGEDAVAAGTADPVPQALILTAIVIGFGILAFFIVLAYRTYVATGTDDPEALNTTDRLSYGEESPEDSLALPETGPTPAQEAAGP